MPKRRPPKAEIIEYKRLKASSGGGGGGGAGAGGSSGGGGGFYAGQNLVCKIVKAEPGGYAVIIPAYNLPGFLPTQALLRTGDEILGQFVCVHNHRILLSARFNNNLSKLAPTPIVCWEEHLAEIATLENNVKHFVRKSDLPSDTPPDETTDS
jgi:hypothetical protein